MGIKLCPFTLGQDSASSMSEFSCIGENCINFDWIQKNGFTHSLVLVGYCKYFDQNTGHTKDIGNVSVEIK